MRLYSLDIARLVFAFLVVTIHIPPIGFSLINPLAFMGVPFFYVLTGYFIYSDSCSQMGKLSKALKNYAGMWIVYFTIITSFTIVLKLYYHNPLGIPTRQDIVDLFWTYGNCAWVELVEIGGQRYGTSALWFLYGGILSLSLLYATRRYMLRRWYAAMVAALWILYACVNLKGQTIYVPRTIGASLPYLYVGILLPRWQKSMSMPFRQLQILLGAAIVLLYIEYVMLHPIGYARLMLLPVTVILFCSIIRIRRVGGILLQKYQSGHPSTYMYGIDLSLW